MTILVQQKNQKQKIFIIIALIMFAAMAFVIWQGFFKKPTAESEQILIFGRQEEVRIDFDVLGHPFLKIFQPFFEIQPFSTSTSTSTLDKIGRENPFIPAK